MYDLLPESLLKIQQRYISIKDNGDDIELDDFYDTFIYPFYDITDYYNKINQLKLVYNLTDVDNQFYLDVINTTNIMDDPDGYNMFDEFLLYLSYFNALQSDSQYIVLNKLTTAFLTCYPWDDTILSILLQYALSDIYFQDDNIIEVFNQYKNNDGLPSLLFVVFDVNTLLIPHIKARVFDNLVPDYIDPAALNLIRFNLLRELLHEPIMGQWFHLLSIKSQSKIREYLVENPDDKRLVYLAPTDKKGLLLLQQYVAENNIDIDFTRPIVQMEKPLVNRFIPTQVSQRVGAKIGRNDQCPCGSGKKYKKCCLS